MTCLEEITVIRAPLERVFDLARSVEVHLAGNVHWGETAVAEQGVTSGLLARGDRVTWRARHFGIRWKLASEITAMERPGSFQDAMIRGPFGMMRHDHFFRAVGANETEMRDVFCFAAPLGVLGAIGEAIVLRRYMRRLLVERNAAIKSIAESNQWRRYLAV
jgi:ligand-binding SRPBCC domain-containing protein